VSLAALDRTVRLLGGDLFPRLSPRVLVAELAATKVLIAAERAELNSLAAQHAVVTSFVCLAELGFEIYLAMPEVELLAPQPPLRGARLRAGLLDLGNDLIAPARLHRGERMDAAVALGRTEISGLAPSVQVMRVAGDDWGGAVVVDSDPCEGFRGHLPFGATLAAVAAGAEVTRIACARIARERGLRVAAEFDLGGPHGCELRLPELALVPGVELAEFDVVSAGAITHACFFNLLRIQGARGSARIFDSDRSEETNLNRYAMQRRSTLGQAKVHTLVDMASEGLGIEPVESRLDDRLAARVRLRNRVLVGVDHIPSRWTAQRHSPGWLCVAGTSHFTAMVSEHEPRTPCAACLHPRDDPNAPMYLPTISFVSLLAGTLQAHRLLAHVSGLPAAPPLLAAGFNLGSPEALAKDRPRGEPRLSGRLRGLDAYKPLCSDLVTVSCCRGDGRTSVRRGMQGHAISIERLPWKE